MKALARFITPLLMGLLSVLPALAAIQSQHAVVAKKRTAAGGGGIAFSAVFGDARVGGPGSDPQTVSNVVAPADCVLICFVAELGSAVTVTSVKFNTTETFTTIQALNDQSGGVSARLGAYILHTPTATTANVVVDWSGDSGGSVAVHVLVYTGVENDGAASGCYRALVNGGDAGGFAGYDASVAATSGDWIVAGLANWDNGNNATSSALSHTSRRSDQNIGSAAYDCVTQDTNGTVGGTTSMTWTNDEGCTVIAFALIPNS